MHYIYYRIGIVFLVGGQTYCYIWNPLHKEFNLGLIALIFSLILLISGVVFRKRKVRRMLADLIELAGFIIAYFII
jgi:intracellular septation protein A